MSFIIPKGKTGLPRLLDATRCSWRGIVAAWRHEDAFRMDVLLALVLVPIALLLPRTGLEKALLVGSVLLVLLVELLNSAIEATVDRISTEHHVLSGRAKDMGSAAVAASLLMLFSTWMLVLLG
jgi:diacylglycerol kinase (ATP)